MEQFVDHIIKCSSCGSEFTLTARDQRWLRERKLDFFKRCKQCRDARKARKAAEAPAQGLPYDAVAAAQEVK